MSSLRVDSVIGDSDLIQMDIDYANSQHMQYILIRTIKFIF